MVLGIIDRTALSLQALVGAALLYLLYAFVTRERPVRGIPIITIDSELQGFQKWLPAGLKFVRYAAKFIDKGLQQYPNACFQVYTFSGYKVIAPLCFAKELGQNPSLTTGGVHKKDYFANYPGFKDFHQFNDDEKFVSDLVRINLGRNLHLYTADLVDECNHATQMLMPQTEEWQTFYMKDFALDLIARVGYRVLVGPELCREEEWLELAKTYAPVFYSGSLQLRLFPAFSRPLVQWFIPSLKKLRQGTKSCRRYIQPEFERRRKEAERALSAGKEMPKFTDALGWIVEMCLKGREADPVAAQLTLSMAAIKTTAEVLSNYLIKLCEEGESIPALREEMTDVLRQNGWQKASLYKMWMLDSFMKEAHRTRGLYKANLNRYVQRTITLSDGTILPAGSRLMISSERAFDPAFFPQPYHFDVNRFRRLRENPGEKYRHQFSVLSADLITFGYSPPACPGRYIATDLLKVVLTFLLLRFDLRFVPIGEGLPSTRKLEHHELMRESSKFQLRRRHEEVDLLSPKDI